MIRWFHASLASRLGWAAFCLATVWIINFGWVNRRYNFLVPESGLGYAFGIIGGVLMLLLLLYSLRKRVRWMKTWGPVRNWFRIHMILGVLGPVLILFHANFQLGSMNSNVAFFSMLLVSTSGLFGRFIFTRIHFGLYGSKATLEELKDLIKNDQGEIFEEFNFSEGLRSRLIALPDQALTRKRTLPAAFIQFSTMFFWIEKTQWVIHRMINYEIKGEAQRSGWTQEVWKRERDKAHRLVNSYMRHLWKVAGFELFGRVFGFWHVLHFPLVLMLLFSGVFHVWAVHAY
ncbi:MAG: pyridine nucleotide-disulfide oxidoreductase [Nitrospinaceae bacterium]